MSDAWFAWHIAPDGNPEDGCHSQEAATLERYLRSATMTPETAARTITLSVENQLDLNKQNLDLYGLWGLIIDALTDLPEHRVKMIHLLQAIQTLPVDRTDTEAARRQVQWACLPSFGHLWSDLRVTDNWRNSIYKWGLEQREGVRQDYIKQASIEAQLIVAKVGDLLLAGVLGCICDALERRDAALDFEVPATRKWLQIAGKEIFEQSDGEMTAYLKERDLWKDDEAGKARWRFWEERLQDIAETEELEPETKQAAKQAFEAIGKIAID